MKRFFISDIAASGENVEYSSVPLKDGVNFIIGPSNTGKSHIVGCINFMFGGEETPFSKIDTGYDTVLMTLKTTDGYTINTSRKIVDSDTGEKGATTVQVDSNVPDIQSGDYNIGKKEYSDLLLKLIGIDKRTQIIATQKLKPNDLTIRTIFHFFFLDEDHIFEKRTPFDCPGHSKITSSLTSLLYLITGDNLNSLLPNVSAEELEKQAIQKAGVITYLTKKIQFLREQKEQLEKSVAMDESVDIEEKVETILSQIDDVEHQISSATEKSRKLLSEIYSINGKLQEAKYLDDRYRGLQSQYTSDIKRLQFIVDGDSKGKNIRHKDTCPFCGHEMDHIEEERTSYAESARSELARVKLQLEDLRITQEDTDKKIHSLEARLKILNAENSEITNKLNHVLRPHAAELKTAVSEYKRILQTRQKLESIEYMSGQLTDDFEQKENEEEEKADTFDAKETFDRKVWKELSDSFNQMVKDCAYTGTPDSILSIDTADAVVGGKHKKNQGKGYRAFLNTIMLFNLMKYLEQKGKYASHFLVLDSPILSLKEAKHKLGKKDKISAGMRESLIQYIIDNCGDNQVIIAENELPETVDYTNTNQIVFTMEDGPGQRYGFLKSVRN